MEMVREQQSRASRVWGGLVAAVVNLDSSPTSARRPSRWRATGSLPGGGGSLLWASTITLFGRTAIVSGTFLEGPDVIPGARPGRRVFGPGLSCSSGAVVLSQTIFTVTSTGSGTSGSGTSGTLPYVTSLANANSNTAGSEIVFDPTVFSSPQTITLTAGMLELTGTTGPISIAGPAAGVTVSGGGLIGGIRVFQVDSGVTAAISGLTISGGWPGYGSGGGMANFGTATLTECTLSGNTALNGGGVYNFGGADLTLTDCTLSGNYAFGSGGGVWNSGTADLTLTDCTLTGNYVNGYAFGVGGGLDNGGVANLTGTIIAGNGTSGNGLSDIGGASDVSGSDNLIGTGSGGLVNGVNGNLVGVYNPGLGTLGNYGGSTETIPLLPGSPAIGAGIAVAGVAADQRGEPLDSPNPDIGAFQSQGFTITPAAGSTPQTAAISTAFPNPLALSVTANNPVEPVDGGVVAFLEPPVSDGASALLAASSAVIAGGQASVTAEPNNLDGSYTVMASASGASPVTFDLTNTGPAFAQLIVNTTSAALLPGAGLLSLPEAVHFANFGLGNANISFDSTVFSSSQTITLTGTQLELSNTSETETITGPAAGVTISGGGNSRVFVIDSGVTASISGLTISGGWVVGVGGGVLNSGTAIFTDCTLSGNSAADSGGDVYVFGMGGAMSNGGAAYFTDCTLSGNSAGWMGGGVINFGSGKLTLTDCTLSSNSSPNGGAVRNLGVANLTDCTLSGNSANFGGGALDNSSGTANLTDCTVSGNSAGGTGGGVYNPSYGTANLTDTIVAGNTNPSGASDIGGAGVVSGSNNLIGTGGSEGLVNGESGNIVLTSLTGLGLAPLGNNGGPTQTMALLPGSPAIDAGRGSIFGITIPATDQRGRCAGRPGSTPGPPPTSALRGHLVVSGHQSRRLARCRHPPRRDWLGQCQHQFQPGQHRGPRTQYHCLRHVGCLRDPADDHTLSEPGHARSVRNGDGD